MMRYRGGWLAALLVCVLSTGVASAAPPKAAKDGSADPQVLLSAVRDNRRALVAVNLNLAPDEAAAFWPLYDRYQQEIHAVDDRLVALIEDYRASFRDLADAKALQLVDDYLTAEAERLKVRRAYVPEFAKVLPGRTVARLYQIENKMDAVLRYDLAATIPVVDDARPTPAP
ncbi:MAG: hypothetical protein ABI629_13175 [bacterium]